MARRKGNNWYIGGINAENIEKQRGLEFSFLPIGTTYKLTLIADGEHDKSFKTLHTTVSSTSSMEVKLLRRGGFAAYLEPIK